MLLRIHIHIHTYISSNLEFQTRKGFLQIYIFFLIKHDCLHKALYSAIIQHNFTELLFSIRHLTMSQLPPNATPTAKSSATKAVPTPSSRLQTGGPSLQQAQKQQRKNHGEVSLTDRTRAAPPAKSNSTAPPKDFQRTLRSDPSRGSNGGTGEDPSDPVVVNYQGPDKFYSFDEKDKMWEYVMKNVKSAGS